MLLYTEACGANWQRDTGKSVVVHLRSRDRTFSFFTRWPISYSVKTDWPEVYFKALHFAVVRSTWYCKYEPHPVLRDVPPSDDPRLRLRVADDIQRAIWNILLPDSAFARGEEQLRSEIQKENANRWLAYGPGTHGQSDAEGVELYRNTRVLGYIGNGDAPAYNSFCIAVARKRKKSGAGALSYAE